MEQNLLCIKLKDRLTKILSFSFRDSTLSLDYYYLQIVPNDSNERIISERSKLCVIPKFEVDKSNKQIASFLLNSTEWKFVVHLLSCTKETLMSFKVDMANLYFLGKELREIKILHYPILLIELDRGFYTTEDNFERNRIFISLQIQNEKKTKEKEENMLKGSKLVSNKVVTLNQNQHKNSGNENGEIVSGIIPRISKEKKEPQYNFQEYLIEFSKMKKIPIFDAYSSNEREILEKTKKYSNDIDIKKNRIKAMKEEKDQLEKEKEIIDIMIGLVEETIKKKQQLKLKIANNSLEINKNNSIKKEEEYKKNYARIGRYEILFNSMIYKKLIEISYIFFNKANDTLFSLEKTLSDDEQQRFETYSQNEQMFTNYMGNVALLFYYISKTFHIPLRFPIFPSGSKSYCLQEKKVFVNLYPIKNDVVKLEKFEKGLQYQKENLKQIVNFCFVLKEIIGKNDYDTFIKKANESSFFNCFSYFESLIYKFISTICKEENNDQQILVEY